VLLAQLTAGQDVRIIKDLGLAAISIFGLFIAVFIGIGLVSKEVDKKSVFGLLSKPLSRTQFILGKYAGLVTTLAVNLGVMTIAYFAMLYYMNVTSAPNVRLAWPTPAMDPRLLIAIGLWVAGHFNADFRNFETVVNSPVAIAMARGLYYLLPNLGPFDVKSEVVYGMPISMRTVAFTLAYAAVYIGILLSASVAIFRRRDFK
jgi:ABC-type transport system involved in multi-copper enzyme maturation permease subunit